MSSTTCLALSGGVGGAKLALGLSHAMDPAKLLIVANTGDDFDHLGLRICPDIDTVTYTLSGLANPSTGWGRKDESWSFMETLESLGGETWFRLGDRDLALHVERTRRLGDGESLSAITDAIATRLAISCRIAPMSDDPVRTIVETPNGPLAFQHYFVRDQCRPAVTGFRFDGADSARPGPTLKAALTSAALKMVVICPSNPFISIDPILAIPTVREMLTDCPAPVIAVSPIVGGRAIKGPTAKMLAELRRPSSALAIAEHYRGLIDGFIIDTADAGSADAISELGSQVRITNTVMKSIQDRVSLARDVVAFAQELH
ncbi:MAG: 2-phospho-L-lactate transferase [Alphaproteobacteria bacterium]